MGAQSRAYAAVAAGTDIVSAAPNVSLQKARTWDEGVSSNFATTPLKDIFKVFVFAFVFLFTLQLSKLSSFLEAQICCLFCEILCFRTRKSSSLASL